MKYRISKYKLRQIIINLIVVFLVYILYLLHTSDIYILDIKKITIIGSIINVCIVLNFYIKYKNMKSVYFLFQLFSLPFLYGQIFVRYVMNIICNDIFDLSRIVNISTEVRAVFLIVFSQLFLNLGYIIKRNIEKDKENRKGFYDNKKIFFIIGFVLIAISIIPAFINYYETFVACMKSGYSGKRLITTYGINSIYSKITPFFYIGLLSLLIGYKNNRVISMFLLLFGIGFYGSQIIFGNRGIPLLMVICYIWFYHNYIRKFEIKSILLMFVISIFCISFLNIVRNNRENGFSNWMSKSNELLVENLTTHNPIIELCYEVGTTIYPITYTLDYIPNITQYKYGMNYIYSLLSVVRLNTSSESNSNFTSKMNIAIEVTNKSGIPFGGSYIQEAYANFGYFSVIFMLILGIATAKIDNHLIYSNSCISAILITYFSTSLLWVIRNTMTTIPREVVWYMLPTYILYKLILNSEKKKGGYKIERKSQSVCYNGNIQNTKRLFE